MLICRCTYIRTYIHIYIYIIVYTHIHITHIYTYTHLPINVHIMIYISPSVSHSSAEVLSSGAIRFHFDLASIWEIKDNVTKIELNFMIHHSGEDSLKVAVKFCKITQYICDPVATVVTPSTVDGYSVVTVLVTSLALSPPDNSILTFTVKTNGNVVESTVSEFICEPLLLVCSTSIPSAAPSFRTRKQKRSVASTLQGGNDSYDHVLTEGEEHHAVKRLTATCLLRSHVVKFAELGISNVASPTSMDIQKCSGGCAVENTYSNNGVKHTELMALDGGTYVSCSPLTYGADVVIYSNPDGSFSIVVEENIKALSCGCR